MPLARPKEISVRELPRRAEEIVQALRSGQTLVLTYRGRPVARLQPIEPPTADEDDPFYRLAEIADRRRTSLTNGEIDEILYGVRRRREGRVRRPGA